MNDVSQLLNNPTLNRFADLFLDFLELNKCSLTYRRLKNAVILFATVGGDMESVCAVLSQTDEITPEQIHADIVAAIDHETIHNVFNAAYCDGQSVGFMPHYKNPDDCIAFLGITFLYILETNYPEYRAEIMNYKNSSTH